MKTKCKRKDCYWYSKKEKSKCCLDPTAAGWDCIQSGFEEHYNEEKNIMNIDAIEKLVSAIFKDGVKNISYENNNM